MPDHRVHFVPAGTVASDLILGPDEAHHLVVVNRAREGDPVVAFDGQGTEWFCELVSAKKASAVLRVRESRRAAPLPFYITLAQAIPKGPCMDAIIRKATEIGVRRILPMVTERTLVRLDEGRQDRKNDKWQVATVEAAKQCGNPWLPDLSPQTPFSAVLTQSAAYDLKLIASLAPGARSLRKTLADFFASHPGLRQPRALWLVGPEGDFTPEETAQALAAGFQPVTLGPLVLRCETAATYALSILSSALTEEVETAL